MLTLWDLLGRKNRQRPARVKNQSPERERGVDHAGTEQSDGPGESTTSSTNPKRKHWVQRDQKNRRNRKESPSPLAPHPKGEGNKRLSMRQRYEAMTRDALRTYGVRVHRWRSSMTGCAWEVHYHNGGVSRLIQAPKPKGPMSAAIFLHEIGHHAIGFGRYSPRCLEEYEAWAWALREMDRHGLTVTDAVRKRMRDSLEYAVRKAQRRGLKRVPPQVAAALTTETDGPLEQAGLCPARS